MTGHFDPHPISIIDWDTETAPYLGVGETITTMDLMDYVSSDLPDWNAIGWDTRWTREIGEGFRDRNPGATKVGGWAYLRPENPPVEVWVDVETLTWAMFMVQDEHHRRAARREGLLWR